jgi:hypothetical protein
MRAIPAASHAGPGRTERDGPMRRPDVNGA